MHLDNKLNNKPVYNRTSKDSVVLLKIVLVVITISSLIMYVFKGRKNINLSFLTMKDQDSDNFILNPSVNM